MISVVIRTIGRDTLIYAIESALREFKNIIVVADNVELDLDHLPKNVKYLKTGQKFDQYGSAAINMGAYACETEFFALLDDDDEFVVGAGDFMRNKIVENPEVDVWVPGIKFNTGIAVCLDSSFGVIPGNVAVPTYRTTLLFKCPFREETTQNPNVPVASDYTDFSHAYEVYLQGARFGWYGQILYDIRPRLAGTNGRGQT